MKKKIVWLLVSCMMALSLVMASCAPAVVEEEVVEEEVVVEEEIEEEEEEEEVVAPVAEVPKYGGLLKIPFYQNITEFDEIVGSGAVNDVTLHLTNEELWQGDWARGPAGGYGTNETDWTGQGDVWALKTGHIAESWELPTKIEGDLAAVYFHIRKGIKWALNPVNPRPAEVLVGGRELTTDDVVFSLRQVIQDPRSDFRAKNLDIADSIITSPEEWTVKIEFPWDVFETGVSRFGNCVRMVPPEVVEEYDLMSKWNLSVGTGPFILADFVDGSVATLVRNPDYWMKDPVGPGKGNQLPYIDGLKYFIIPDQSTMYAAFRTGKLDWGGSFAQVISKEDADILKKQVPQLKSKRTAVASPSFHIGMKIDREPFNDIRVRRALMMAIDFESIKRDLYGGDAQILTWPIPYVKEYADAYLGLDDPECPESVKELYSYNPEKAKALLAEAGYADGLKTSLIVRSRPEIIDYFSIYVDMWSKVGVDCELLIKEGGAFSTVIRNQEFEHMLSFGSTSIGRVYRMTPFRGAGLHNPSSIDDPLVDEAFVKVQRAIAVGNFDEANRLSKELMKYVLDQAWQIPKVFPANNYLWWPWVKNYSGEYFLGYTDINWPTWIWLDQELKESMGY
ncbi:ABC transporter substrate-binding protein [Chloroflexota bacterium]